MLASGTTGTKAGRPLAVKLSRARLAASGLLRMAVKQRRSPEVAGTRRGESFISLVHEVHGVVANQKHLDIVGPRQKAVLVER